MIATERPDLATNLVIAISKIQREEYKAGHNFADEREVGLTGLLGCLYQEYLKFTGKITEENPLSAMRPMIGTGLHGGFTRAAEGSEIPVFLMTAGGNKIASHIDMSWVQDGVFTPGELKTTWAGKVKDGELPNGHYLEQVGTYCYINHVLRAELYILNIIPAQMHCWEIEWTQEELDEWIVELGRRADKLIAWKLGGMEGDVAEALFPEHQDWNCKWCPSRGTICPGGGGRAKHWFGDKEE